MTTGQAVLIGGLGAPEVGRVLDELEALETERSAAHAAQLEQVLLLDRALTAQGRALGSSLLQDSDTTWDLDLQDLYRWLP